MLRSTFTHRPLAVAALIFALFALPMAVGTRAHAQAILVGPLEAPDSARAVGGGEISPDGKQYLYQVLEGKQHSLWIFELHEQRARRILLSGEAFREFAWSPDASQIAFWRTSDNSGLLGSVGELAVFEVAAKRLHRLDTLPNNGRFEPARITWLDDGRIVTGYAEVNWGDGGHRDTAFAYRPAGGRAPMPPGHASWLLGGGLSRAGQLAYFGGCCGGSRGSIQLIGPAGDRCVAGPTPRTERALRWDESRRRLYLLSTEWRDHGLGTLYAMDPAWPGARRVLLPPTRMWYSSMSSAGDLWFLVEDPPPAALMLWVIRSDTLAKYTSATDTLPSCPPIQAAIDALARAEYGSRVIIDEVYKEPSRRLTIFTVNGARIGLAYGDRLGWMSASGRPAPTNVQDSSNVGDPLFPLRDADTYLFSEILDSLLGTDPELQFQWRVAIAGAPATPAKVVLRILRRNADRFTPIVLANPRVANDSLPFDLRLGLVEVNQQFALAAFALPSVRSDPERLARIASLPRYRANERVLSTAHARLRDLQASLAKNAARLSEDAAIHAFFACAGAGTDGCPPTLEALITRRSPRTDRVVLALAASCRTTPTDSPLALTAQRALGGSPDQALLSSLGRVQRGELTQSLPFLLLQCGAGVGRWHLLDAMSRMDERFSVVRDAALIALATDASTPDSVRSLLVRDLSVRRNYALAGALVTSSKRRNDSVTLMQIAQLDPANYGGPVRDAGMAMRVVAGFRDPPPPPPRPPQRPDPGLPAGPAAPPAPPRRMAPPPPTRTLCLATDDSSGALSRAVGEHAKMAVSDSLCWRATTALDSAFTLANVWTANYLFSARGRFFAARRPVRPDVDVTLIEFDSAFVERGQRTVRVP